MKASDAIPPLVPVGRNDRLPSFIIDGDTMGISGECIRLLSLAAERLNGGPCAAKS
jgi:hypothetical protein